VAFVGVEENFIGGAMGLLGSPITDARFWWNFGDGGTAEGKSVGHTYRETGTYTAVLSVTSGGYAATDYTQIRVEPNKISLAGVTAGEVGGIRIANPASAGADIGGWALEDDRGRVFFLPVHTVIGPGGEAVFANKITGLDPRTKVTLRYPGGQAATIWESQTVSGATQVEVGTPLFIPTQAGSGDGRVSFVADTAVRFATARHGAAAGTVLSAGAVASSSESAPRDSGSGGTEGSHLSRIFFAAASAGSFIAAACFFIIRRMID
jgi:PKD repeat protein